MDMSLEQTSPRFWNKIADKYARQAISDQAAYEHKLAKTREILRPDMRVLEFGCGTGGTAILHAPYVREIHAIDFAQKMIDHGTAKAEAANVQNVQFAVDAIETFRAPEHPLDAVLGLSVLHLVADMPGVIAKVHSLLAPGGYFVTSTTCMSDLNPAMKFIFHAGRALRLFPMVQFFDANTLKGMMTKAGFDIEYAWSPSGTGKAKFIIARKKA